MAEHTSRKMVIRACPDDCFEVVSNFSSYPLWASDIKEVNVLELDDLGRPHLVSFRAAAFGRSSNYTLKYDYSKAPYEISWHQIEGDITSRLEGSYVFDSMGQQDTEVTYYLDVELGVPLPSFVKRRAQSRIVSTALEELRARVEVSN